MNSYYPPSSSKYLTTRSPSLVSLIFLGILVFMVGCTDTGGTPESPQGSDFTLPESRGGSITLSDYRGSQPVLLFFHMAVG